MLSIRNTRKCVTKITCFLRVVTTRQFVLRNLFTLHVITCSKIKRKTLLIDYLSQNEDEGLIGSCIRYISKAKE